LSERASLAETVDEAEQMPVAFFHKFGDPRKIVYSRIGKVEQ
jgi:hypothetical protein